MSEACITPFTRGLWIGARSAAVPERFATRLARERDWETQAEMAGLRRDALARHHGDIDQGTGLEPFRCCS
jgi:hypothetical protein